MSSTDDGHGDRTPGSNVRHPDAAPPPAPHIALPPGRYRVWGFPPETGLLLNKWIEVHETNRPGHYGPADLPIGTSMPNLLRVEDQSGRAVWTDGKAG